MQIVVANTIPLTTAYPKVIQLLYTVVAQVNKK